MKILVVEDEKITRHLITSILEESGHETVSSISAGQAMEFLLSQQSIDLIIADIVMPGMDGLRLIRMIKKNRILSRIPILICSSRTDVETVTEAAKLGAKGFIAKPVEAVGLLLKVSEMIDYVVPKIMIVDDEPMMRDLLMRMVGRTGFGVTVCGSADEALMKMKVNKIGMIITDIMMPGKTGLELMAEVHMINSKLPVVVITGKSDQRIKNEAMLAGAAGFIRKPFKSVEIAQVITRAHATSKVASKVAIA